MHDINPPTCGTIDIWTIPLDIEITDQAPLESLLDDNERQRFHRLHQSKHLSFLLSHAACRIILSSYCQHEPELLQFHHNQHGKPDLIAERKKNISFNLSHSHNLALLAIATDCELGIDLEFQKPRSNWEKLSRRFYSDSEFNFLMGMQDKKKQMAAFYQLWSIKEAFIKALGTGMSTPLPSFSVIQDNHYLSKIAHPDNDRTQSPPAANWYVEQISTSEDYKAALVSSSPIKKIIVKNFNFDLYT